MNKILKLWVQCVLIIYRVNFCDKKVNNLSFIEKDLIAYCLKYEVYLKTLRLIPFKIVRMI